MGEKAVWQALLKERTALSPLNLSRVRPTLGGAGAEALTMWLHRAGEGSSLRVVRQCRSRRLSPCLVCAAQAGLAGQSWGI